MKKIIASIIIICILLSSFSFVVQGTKANTYSRPSVSDGPEHSGELINVIVANTTKVLIVTEGYGPLTGISPIEEKDFWVDVLLSIPADLDVDWFDGIPTFELLADYDLVIYDAGGYWYPLSHVAEPLRQYHFTGKPLIVVAPDINYDWYLNGEPVPSFTRDVLHIEGILGIMPEAIYSVYANTGHEITYGISPEIAISIPALTSWPDCFDPLPDCKGAITQGYIPETEFGVGTCSILPSYSPYEPETALFAVVAYPGEADIEGRTVTFGFPPSGLENVNIAKQIAKNSIIYCLSSLPTKYSIQVQPSNLKPNIDEVVTFSGVVTDEYGKPVPNIKIGVEDPIKECSTWVVTDANGQFTYITKTNRAGEFTFIFYVNSVPTKSTIKVSPLNAIWGGQVLYVKNPIESDPYEVSVHVNDILEGIWTIEPGQEKVLWEAPDPFSSYDLDITYKNLVTQEQWNVNLLPYVNYNTAYIPYCSEIPPNPSLYDFYIQTTSTYVPPEMCPTCTPSYMTFKNEPISYNYEYVSGPIKAKMGIDAGPFVEAKPHISAGCEVYFGFNVKCSCGCFAEAAVGLEVGVCVGLCLPVRPIVNAGCGCKCSIGIAGAGCSVEGGIQGQAGYSACGGIEITTESPVLVTVVDPLGRKAGYVPEINYKTKLVPGAIYYNETEMQKIVISNALLGDYIVIITGIGDGSYTLTVTRTVNGEIVYSYSYKGEIVSGDIHKSTITISVAEGIFIVNVTEPEPWIPDQTPPETTLTIGEPKYSDVKGNIYVSSVTTFTLNAEDDTGVASTFYRVYNDTFATDWMEYYEPFVLVGFDDGKYSIEYYSIDNAGNVEQTNTVTVILFSWQYTYEDYEKGITLKINANHRFFQFITPDKDFGIRQATIMYESYVTVYCNGEYVSLPAIIIRHNDGELRLLAYAGTEVPFCYARAVDYETGNRYMLRVDPKPLE